MENGKNYITDYETCSEGESEIGVGTDPLLPVEASVDDSESNTGVPAVSELEAVLTFERWVTSVARPGDNPRGDFIRDTREHVNDSRGRWRNGEVTTLSGLRWKMQEVGRPGFEAVQQAERCWRDYRRAMGGIARP